jgi:hypothetical protein
MLNRLSQWVKHGRSGLTSFRSSPAKSEPATLDVLTDCSPAIYKIGAASRTARSELQNNALI